MMSAYSDFDSEEKAFVNDYVSTCVSETGGSVMFLDSFGFRTMGALLNKGVEPNRMIIVERDDATYNHMVAALRGHQTEVIKGDICKYLGKKHFQNLYLDLMSYMLTPGEIRETQKWLKRVLSYGSSPNLFITLCARGGPDKGSTFRQRFGYLCTVWAEIHPLLRPRIVYGYQRTVGESSPMVFMHFCVHEEDTEFRPHKIIAVKPGWTKVKWYGFSKEFSDWLPNDSDAVQILKGAI